MKDSLVTQLLDILHLFSLKTPINERFHQRKETLPCTFSMRKGVKREDIKKEFKTLFKPVIDFIVHEITPYIYLIVILLLLILIIVFSIFFILINALFNKNIFEKLFRN
jgi:hypothetical protein